MPEMYDREGSDVYLYLSLFVSLYAWQFLYIYAWSCTYLGSDADELNKVIFSLVLPCTGSHTDNIVSPYNVVVCVT